MYQGCSEEPAASRVARTSARAAWVLVGAASLAGCSAMRGDLCTTVHTRVLEELRTTDGAPRHVSDPWASERNARRLRELAEELRRLDIRDAALREAVVIYRAEVERLAEAYERLVAAYKAQPKLPPEEARRAHLPLRLEVLSHAASMSVPRTQVQEACDAR